MASLSIIYWRDIPSQITIKAGRKKAKRELPQRFQEAIDKAAMKAGAHGTEDYLADWRKAAPSPCADDLEHAADTAIIEIEAQYDERRLTALIAAKGFENGKE